MLVELAKKGVSFILDNPFSYAFKNSYYETNNSWKDG